MGGSYSIPLAKSAVLFSTGIFAGQGATLYLATVPALLDTKNPVPTWKQTYKKCGAVALTTINTALISGIWLYTKNGKFPYLVISGLLGFIMPYTLLVMMPVNNQLMAISDESIGQNKETRELVKTWGKMQLVRTLLGLSAFLTNIYIIYWD